jgi:hypothetical protein
MARLLGGRPARGAGASGILTPARALIALALAIAIAVAIVLLNQGPPHRLFSPTSVWNAPLAPNAPLDPTSPRRMRSFDAEVRSEITAGSGPWIADASYSTPIYVVGGDQRKVPVKLDTGAWGDPLRAALRGGVPLPPRARPAAGTDGHITVWQPDTDTLWEFWRARHASDGWHAAWGGVIHGVSASPGYYRDGAGEHANWGATASSLPVVAGTIRISELNAGHIDHALALDVPVACKGVFSWPAQRTDGYNTAPTCLPEGAHLRLDPHLDLSKLQLPRITRMLAVAAQRYGMIVRDQTARATALYAEDPTPTGTNPYPRFYGGLKPWTFLPQFPWQHVQLLAMTTCTATPCRQH